MTSPVVTRCTGGNHIDIAWNGRSFRMGFDEVKTAWSSLGPDEKVAALVAVTLKESGATTFAQFKTALEAKDFG